MYRSDQVLRLTLITLRMMKLDKPSERYSRATNAITYHSFVSSKNSGMNSVRYIMIIYLPRNQMRDTDAGRHALTAKCCFALLKSEVHEQHRTRIFVTSGGCHSKESVVIIII